MCPNFIFVLAYFKQISKSINSQSALYLFSVVAIKCFISFNENVIIDEIWWDQLNRALIKMFWIIFVRVWFVFVLGKVARRVKC